MTLEFYPHWFDVKDLDQAKRAVVGDIEFSDGGHLRHDDRWEPETAYAIDFIADHLPITEESTVLDYGCGMGRIAKGLIERFGCGVLGIDSSESMRRLAEEYVGSDRFAAAAETTDEKFADVAICIWVLEHCPVPKDDIERIKRSLKPGGKLLVFDNSTRNVPTASGFANDGADVTIDLGEAFGTPEDCGHFDPERMHPKICARHFWAIYRKNVKLNLGCAFNKMPDAENVDISPLCKPDRIVDLEKFPWPWESESVDEICMFHSLEHIGGDPNVFLAVMRELYRVLKPGASVYIHVPHPRHDNYIGSPTHVRPITTIVLEQFSLAWNKETREGGFANETFAMDLGVDFKVTEKKMIIAKPWWEKYQRGLITKEELEFAVASYWNVVEEYHITIEKVPLNAMVAASE